MKVIQFLIIGIFIFPLISCEQEQEMEIMVSNTCNYDNRLSTNNVEKIRGTIKLANRNIANQFHIEPDDPNLPLLSPCNLPADISEDGKRILFSGEIKEQYANENLRATPFKLTQVVLNK
jgi:hypothetical protein